MKMRVLLTLTFIVLCSVAAFTQSYSLQWIDADSVRTSTNKTIKRTGNLVNSSFTTKNILFRFSLANVVEGHDASLCFGDNCFFLFPGEDNPTDRPAQTLRELGSLYIVADITPNGHGGISTVAFEFFDTTNTQDKLEFTTTFVVGTTSIEEPASNELRLFPMPATTAVTLEGTLTEQVVGIDLYSAQGSIIRSYNTMRVPSRTLDISGLSSGNYHFLLTLSNGSVLRLPLSIIH